MIYISIGSNLGNRLSNLRCAVDLIRQRVFKPRYKSAVVETEAILKKEAPSHWDKRFLNMVVAGESDLSASELLRELQDIELQIGKVPMLERWSPRVIDLDILLFNNQVINQNDLYIPHRELLNRDFLIHLLAMAPNQQVPSIRVNGVEVRIDEYAHKNIDLSNTFLRCFCLDSLHDMESEALCLQVE